MEVVVNIPIDVRKLFTDGLLSGFAGGTVGLSERGGIATMKSSHYVGSGGVYHDEWVAGIDGCGGGQELVRLTSGGIFTRLYAGGYYETGLRTAQLVEAEVTDLLKSALRQLRTSTRLDVDSPTVMQGQLSYRYRVTHSDANLVAGEEVILFDKATIVFVHDFLICAVK